MCVFTQYKFIELYNCHVCLCIYILFPTKIYLSITRVHAGLFLSFRRFIAEMQVEKDGR